MDNAADYRPARSAAQILARLGDARLDLQKVVGHGYWIFIFDDEAANFYETRSVYVPRLSDMTVARWVEDGRDFAAKCHVDMIDRAEAAAENPILRRMNPTA